MLRYLPFLLAAAFLIYCVFDVIGSDARRRRGLPTVVWLLVVLLLPVVGGVVWLLVSRWSTHGGGTSGHARGPVAPDDDPEFLFRLDQERRRLEQERRRREHQDDPPDPRRPDRSSDTPARTPSA